MRFDADRHGNLALGLEGGHSRRRVAHAGGSATGRRILRELSAVVAEHERIDVLEGRRAGALRLAGGQVTGLDTDDGRTLAARAVILATGGAAALWSRTTNPPGSFGSGLLLARAAGATLADLELVQFHPTAVTGIPGREGFLVSEAVRGEGATLHDPSGERFVDELAPRDEVARAIRAVMDATGATHVDLDMRHVDEGRFPNVVGALREAGLDPMRELVPVSPAAHYVMGGIATDLHGRTAVPGLLAIGECACTGLHGANRLASNSLSECFVLGWRAAAAALQTAAGRGRRRARPRRRHAARARDPRGGLARRRPRARSRRADPPARGPASARPARRRVRARAHGEPRSAPPGRPPRYGSPPRRVPLHRLGGDYGRRPPGVGLTSVGLNANSTFASF